MRGRRKDWGLMFVVVEVDLGAEKTPTLLMLALAWTTTTCGQPQVSFLLARVVDEKLCICQNKLSVYVSIGFVQVCYFRVLLNTSKL